MTSCNEVFKTDKLLLMKINEKKVLDNMADRIFKNFIKNKYGYPQIIIRNKHRYTCNIVNACVVHPYFSDGKFIVKTILDMLNDIEPLKCDVFYKIKRAGSNGIIWNTMDYILTAEGLLDK